jgi:hypothetical protein
LIPLAFTIASAGQRTLGAGDYLVGAVELAAIIGALAFGAVSVRALMLPGWRGAPARLAEVVLGASALIVVSELVGVVGLFTEAAMVAALVVTGVVGGIAARAIARGRAPGPAASPPAPPASSVAKVIALAVVAGLAAAWAVPTLGALAAGMDRSDSLWYHMPLAARWAQTGHVGPIAFFDPIYFASFYPANSEIPHALGILVFQRDIISPLLNEAWLAVALLAAWCIGRPYGLGPVSLIGASVALGAQMLVEFQAGEALNDITGVAFTLAAAALLVNGYAGRRSAGEAGRISAKGGEAGAEPGSARETRRLAPLWRIAPQTRQIDPGTPGPAPFAAASRTLAPIAIAGLAMGIAAGIKLSFLTPAAVLTVGVILIARRGERMRTGAAWILPMALTGGFWYVRNLVAVGNPIPYIHHLGPISLPGPVRDFSLRPGYAVSHYFTDTNVWGDWFFPGLHDSLGLFWPATVIGVAGIAIYALVRGREPILRLLGALAGVTAVAYLFTPLTAAGVEGQPIAFEWNLRYLAPAVAVAFAILPCLPALRATPGRRAALLGFLTVLVTATVSSLVEWHQGHVKGALAVAALVVGGGAAIAFLAHRGVRLSTMRAPAKAGLAIVALAAVVAAGYGYQVHYLEHRYEDTGERQGLNEPLAWARDVRDARIAIAGIRGVFTQYAFYGDDLSNHVQWLGRRVADDGYARIGTCRAWRKAVNAGHYTHVVTMFDPYVPGGLTDTPEGRWTESDPNAHRVLRQGPVQVFRITGPLDPAGCHGQKPLTERQLHGVPDPTRKA